MTITIPDYPHYLSWMTIKTGRFSYIEKLLVSSKAPSSVETEMQESAFLFEQGVKQTYFSQDPEGQKGRLDFQLLNSDGRLKTTLQSLLFPHYSSLDFWKRRPVDGFIKSSAVYAVKASAELVGHAVVAPQNFLLHILDESLQSVLGMGVSKAVIAQGQIPSLIRHPDLHKVLTFADRYGAVVGTESGLLLNIDRTDERHFYVERLGDDALDQKSDWLLLGSVILTVKLLRALMVMART